MSITGTCYSSYIMLLDFLIIRKNQISLQMSVIVMLS